MMQIRVYFSPYLEQLMSNHGCLPSLVRRKRLSCITNWIELDCIWSPPSRRKRSRNKRRTFNECLRMTRCTCCQHLNPHVYITRTASSCKELNARRHTQNLLPYALLSDDLQSCFTSKNKASHLMHQKFIERVLKDKSKQGVWNTDWQSR
jgi:hypothetical protein